MAPGFEWRLGHGADQRRFDTRCVDEQITLDNLAIRQHDGLNVGSAPVHRSDRSGRPYNTCLESALLEQAHVSPGMEVIAMRGMRKSIRLIVGQDVAILFGGGGAEAEILQIDGEAFGARLDPVLNEIDMVDGDAL